MNTTYLESSFQKITGSTKNGYYTYFKINLKNCILIRFSIVKTIKDIPDDIYIRLKYGGDIIPYRPIDTLTFNSFINRYITDGKPIIVNDVAFGESLFLELGIMSGNEFLSLSDTSKFNEDADDNHESYSSLADFDVTIGITIEDPIGEPVLHRVR